MRNAFHLALALLLGNSCLVLANGYGGVTIDLDGTLHCPTQVSQSSFCGGDSNSTDFIIHCYNGAGRLSACSIDLVGVQPVGVKLGAVCYEASKTSGDAVCIFDGKEFDTKPYGSNTVTTGVGAVPTVPPDSLAEYIMEGIRQHGSN